MREYPMIGNNIGIVINADNATEAMEKAESILLQGFGGDISFCQEADQREYQLLGETPEFVKASVDKYMTMKDLTDNGTIAPEAAILLKTLVECGYNIFVSGGTSSGKTTLLNALAEAIPKEERVIVIEDSMELKLSTIENIVHMECRNASSSGKGSVTMSQLIKSSLRMRPDRIIVGEVIGAEVVDMLQAMNTGHSGSMSTCHGNSVEIGRAHV